MIRIFTGWDERESLGHSVFVHSLIRRATEPVSIIPIGKNVSKSDGTTAFSLARFEIPRLCNYEGWAIWLDGSDMLMRCDIAELWNLRDERYAVQVVKHDYESKAKRKFIGTEMEADNLDYPRKNWSSVMLINCAEWPTAPKKSGNELHRFSYFYDDEIGALPKEFNFLADENGQCAPGAANIIHFTLGLPNLPYYVNCQHAYLWHAELDRMR